MLKLTCFHPINIGNCPSRSEFNTYSVSSALQNIKQTTWVALPHLEMLVLLGLWSMPNARRKMALFRALKSIPIHLLISSTRGKNLNCNAQLIPMTPGNNNGAFSRPGSGWFDTSINPRISGSLLEADLLGLDGHHH